MDRNARAGALNSTHPLWEPMQRCSGGRLSVYAMIVMGEMSKPGRRTPESQSANRLVLLALFNLAEIESWTKDGYNGTLPADLVLWTALTERQVEGQLALLHLEGWVERRADPETDEWRYRPPQWVYDWVNGDS